MPVEDGEWVEDPALLEPPVAPAVRPVDPSDTTSSGPEVETPIMETSLVEEPHPETQVMQDEMEADTDPPLPEFDPKVRQDFEGLLYLGRLTDQFTWLGHTFTIRTLTSGEIVEIGLLHRPYIGSLADVKAYQAAIVAACVLDVDGKPMPTPITNEATDTALLNRFQYVLRSWFSPTLNVVYERYLLLESRVEEVIESMGKASGSTDSIRT